MAGVLQAFGASPEVTLVIVAFFAIAGYNALELLFWIFAFYKRYQGKYFWTMIITVFGLLVYVIAAILLAFNLSSIPLGVSLFAIGYLAMVTAGAMILWSRLDLISSGRVIRLVLWFIIITTCIFQIPLAVFFLCNDLGVKGISNASNIFEKLAITAACAREFIISGIFIWEARRSLKPILAIKGREGNRMFRHLVIVLGIVIILDASLLVTNFANYQPIKIAYSGITNSVKVKMEFSVLNRLLALVKSPVCCICQQQTDSGMHPMTQTPHGPAFSGPNTNTDTETTIPNAHTHTRTNSLPLHRTLSSTSTGSATQVQYTLLSGSGGKQQVFRRGSDQSDGATAVDSHEPHFLNIAHANDDINLEYHRILSDTTSSSTTALNPYNHPLNRHSHSHSQTQTQLRSHIHTTENDPSFLTEPHGLSLSTTTESTPPRRPIPPPERALSWDRLLHAHTTNTNTTCHSHTRSFSQTENMGF